MSNDVGTARLISLDVFRGITIAGMVLVNNPGNWSTVYSPLKHAEWNGWTPTDLIFPFFVFIMGIAIPIAFSRRLETGIDASIYWKILRRSAIIFGLGLIQMGFPFFDLSKTTLPFAVKTIAVCGAAAAVIAYFANRFRVAAFAALGVLVMLALFYLFDQGFPADSFAKLRIPGVLQRLAVCYLAASVIYLNTNWQKQTVIAVGLLLVYWVVMMIGAGGDLTLEGNFGGWIDRLILGESHIWKASKFYDPEGILSTLPAIASCLAGVLCGQWLRTKRTETEKVSAIFFFGVLLTALGWIWNFWFPINKALWTSSYVLFTGGLALCFLGFCYWLIDIKKVDSWTKPFIIFGTNALALYFGSSILARILLNIKWQNAEGAVINVQKWFYDSVFAGIPDPYLASLAFSLFYIQFWLLLMWRLSRSGIFIKV